MLTVLFTIILILNYLTLKKKFKKNLLQIIDNCIEVYLYLFLFMIILLLEYLLLNYFYCVFDVFKFILIFVFLHFFFFQNLLKYFFLKTYFYFFTKINFLFSDSLRFNIFIFKQNIFGYHNIHKTLLLLVRFFMLLLINNYFYFFIIFIFFEFFYFFLVRMNYEYDGIIYGFYREVEVEIAISGFFKLNKYIDYLFDDAEEVEKLYIDLDVTEKNF